MTPGNTFGDVFDAHARTMEAHGLTRHRLNACGYSLGARFTPSWMDMPMFYQGNPEAIAPNMTLFAHMVDHGFRDRDGHDARPHLPHHRCAAEAAFAP